MHEHDFVTLGHKRTTIDVRISFRIIQLFSEGLYSSPNKAIEELVSNAFDAGATKVGVLLSPDLVQGDATIAVIDDGIAMDADGLADHWLIGVSNKRDQSYEAPKGRKPIGKFGIGKLATYVLAESLTHVCKRDGVYLAASMDYTEIPEGAGGLHTDEKVSIDLRELTEAQAKAAVSQFEVGSNGRQSPFPLFGENAPASWTVAIMSDLKDMATEIKRGRLRWILQTAMPLRDDFKLSLNGDPVKSSKLKGKKVGRWVLGKHLIDLPKPADDFEATEDKRQPTSSIHRFGLTHAQLGRVTGYAEAFEAPITGGKSEDIERSNGFFVYAHSRLINVDDPGFGIDRNKLRHGTFSRFRMVAHIDRLDEELRSSRESIRQGVYFNIARNLLTGVFNHARIKLQTHQEATEPGLQAAARIAASPASLANRPLVHLVKSAIAGDVSPRYTVYPRDLGPAEQAAFLAAFKEQAATNEGVVQDVQLVELSHQQGLAVYDAESGVLQVNTYHPFVAHFLDEYEDPKTSLPLELFSISEVVLEADLYMAGVDAAAVEELLQRRDELLRHLARARGGRNARMIAQGLEDSATDKDALEHALVDAFDSMGYDAIPIGGKNDPDGRAEAHLPAKGGKPQRYSVSLEAKSKEKPRAKVSNQGVRVSTVARHRDKHDCDHAIVVGPDFSVGGATPAALVSEIERDHEQTERTITLIRIIDLARLVTLVPLKRVGLDALRGLFECRTPREASEWIDGIEQLESNRDPYGDILEVIAEEQQAQPTEAADFGAVRAALRRSRGIEMTQQDLKECCQALTRMAPGWITVTPRAVEISQRPDKILEAIGADMRDWPPGPQEGDDGAR